MYLPNYVDYFQRCLVFVSHLNTLFMPRSFAKNLLLVHTESVLLFHFVLFFFFQTENKKKKDFRFVKYKNFFRSLYNFSSSTISWSTIISMGFESKTNRFFSSYFLFLFFVSFLSTTRNIFSSLRSSFTILLFCIREKKIVHFLYILYGIYFTEVSTFHVWSHVLNESLFQLFFFCFPFFCYEKFNRRIKFIFSLEKKKKLAELTKYAFYRFMCYVLCKQHGAKVLNKEIPHFVWLT